MTRGHLARLHAKGGGPRPHRGATRAKLGPLRKIVSWEYGWEVLECGHRMRPREDFAGPTNAERRRCWRCQREETTRGAP